MKIIIDRIEGKFAIAELPDKTSADIPLVIFPDVKEGDVVNIEIDKSETDSRKAAIEYLIQNVWGD